MASALSRSVLDSTIDIGSDSALRVSLNRYGAAIRSMRVPAADRHIELVLGYSDDDNYRSDPFYMGSTLGRYAGRIRDGRFRLNGRDYQVGVAGEHCLHGGPEGIWSRRWYLRKHTRDSAQFRYVSAAGEGGFPGRVEITVDYRVSAAALVIDYTASSDADTVINLANHAYFNLSGDGRPVDEQMLTLYADRYTPLEGSIPTGEIVDVAGTPYDCRDRQRIGDIADRLGGIDQNFVLGETGGELRLAAELCSEASGLKLMLLTTQPGLQVYSADGLRPPFVSRGGICLEAQNFPDAPNQPGFPSPLLRPGEVYRQTTRYEVAAL